MDINNPNSANTWVSDDGSAIHCKVVPIGTWNMFAVGTKSIAHGLGANYKNILTVDTLIQTDDTVGWMPIDCLSTSNPGQVPSGGVDYWDNTNIVIRRTEGERFLNGSYTLTLVNRGYIVIYYKQ